MARPTKQEQDEIRERRKRAASLRLAGVDWETIAEQCGYSNAQSAITDLRRAREQSQSQLRESLTELRDRELERLDKMQIAIWPRVAMGDLRALETMLRLMDRRHKLLGLDAPIKHEVITVDEVDKALRDLRERHPELARLDPARDGRRIPEAPGTA